jgi:hypothetical protein
MDRQTLHVFSEHPDRCGQRLPAVALALEGGRLGLSDRIHGRWKESLGVYTPEYGVIPFISFFNCIILDLKLMLKLACVETNYIGKSIPTGVGLITRRRC